MKNEQLPRTNPQNSPTGVPRSTDPGGSTTMRCRSIGITPAHLPAFRADQRCSPASTPTCMVSLKLMVSARWQTIHACDGYEKARYPLSAIGSERPAMTPTTTENGTSPMPICSTTMENRCRQTPPMATYFMTTLTATLMRTLSTHLAFLAGLGLSRTVGSMRTAVSPVTR